MTLPLIPDRSTDEATWRKRVAERINGVLQFDHDDWRKKTESEALAGVTPIDYSFPPGHVRRYGAKGDGVTDDTLAIRTAQSVLNQSGGGTMLFEHGKVYLLSTISTHSVVVPVAAANFQPDTQDMQYHVLLEDVSNIKWDLSGATLQSTITNGGSMFLLDGVRKFEVVNGTIQSVTAKDGSGNTTTSGMHGFGVTSQSRDSFSLRFSNITAKDVFSPIYIFGDADSAYRVRGVEIVDLYHDQGIYTLAFHNNGDNITAKGVHSSAANREYFVYGVDQHDIQISSDTAFSGFASNIKAYDRDTTRIKLSLRTTKSSSQYNVNLESQHAPAVQATPARLIDIHVDVNNIGNAGNEVAVGFQYWRDSTATATSNNNLWTGIRLSGIHLQPPVFNTTQIGTAGAYGTLNTDDLILLNGSKIGSYVGNGLRDSKQDYSTFTPALRVAGSTTGITYGGSTAGEYWRDGRFVEGYARIVLTSKGAGTGTVSMDLPVVSSATNLVNAMIVADGQSNMAGLSGPIIGFVSIGGTTMTFRVQGATGSASLADTNLTNTSDFRVWFRYPI